jgi:hypothetical protein
VKDSYPEPAPVEGQKELLQLLCIYRTDTVRLMNGQLGDITYLFDNLKVGVRLAGSLMQTVQNEKSQSLIGWYHGVKPTNMVQFLYSLLSETALQLSWSILEVESRYPNLKFEFDLERETYQRMHLQWQKEDEAAEAEA